jgi:hypothetical protein
VLFVPWAKLTGLDARSAVCRNLPDHPMTRLITVLVVAVVTSGSSLWWLYDGDLGQVHPALGVLDAAEVGALLGRAPDGSLPDDEHVTGAAHSEASGN